MDSVDQDMTALTNTNWYGDKLIMIWTYYVETMLFTKKGCQTFVTHLVSSSVIQSEVVKTNQKRHE